MIHQANAHSVLIPKIAMVLMQRIVFHKVFRTLLDELLNVILAQSLTVFVNEVWVAIMRVQRQQ